MNDVLSLCLVFCFYIHHLGGSNWKKRVLPSPSCPAYFCAHNLKIPKHLAVQTVVQHICPVIYNAQFCKWSSSKCSHQSISCHPAIHNPTIFPSKLFVDTQIGKTYPKPNNASQPKSYRSFTNKILRANQEGFIISPQLNLENWYSPTYV